MKEFSEAGAATFARRVNDLYEAMAYKLESNEKAWEFILAFYEGAGR